MTSTAPASLSLPEEIAAEFAKLPQVVAVALSGSIGSGCSDDASDVDLYVYATPEPPVGWRIRLAQEFGERASIGNRFWEPGDEWVSRQTRSSNTNGSIVDIMYRSPGWIEDQLDRVLLRHQASVGYSTCFVYNILHSRTLFDRTGWFAALRAKAEQPYPEPLRRAIVAKNHPILRRTLSSYMRQIDLAAKRGDRVSVNHRLAALLASYFDILFAVNRLPHPGEKRLVAHASEKCLKCPVDFQRQIERLLSAALPDIQGHISGLLDGLDALLLDEGLIAAE